MCNPPVAGGRGEETIVSSAAEIPDRIEQDIAIDAPPERVWEFVSEPGWWIGDGDRSGHVVTREGDLVVVADPRWGRFAVLTVSFDAPRHVSFRSAYPGQDPREVPTTLLEFFLTEQDGGTLLRVVESGFASLAVPPEERASQLEDNTAGWEFQLGAAKRDTERVGA
jgi:uncharacterized protein YndB with AHSA1/START domain